MSGEVGEEVSREEYEAEKGKGVLVEGEGGRRERMFALSFVREGGRARGGESGGSLVSTVDCRLSQYIIIIVLV